MIPCVKEFSNKNYKSTFQFCFSPRCVSFLIFTNFCRSAEAAEHQYSPMGEIGAPLTLGSRSLNNLDIIDIKLTPPGASAGDVDSENNSYCRDKNAVSSTRIADVAGGKKVKCVL